MHSNGLGYLGDESPTDPFFDPTPYTTYPSTQPSTNTSFTSSVSRDSGGGFDWGSNITSWLNLAPSLISSIKGNPYASGQYGQQGGGAGGLNLQGSVPFLGGGSFGLSSNTLLLLAVAVVAVFALRK